MVEHPDAPPTMRAIVQRELGDPDVLRLETVPRPEPAATEVLVRVAAAGVNPVDWKTRRRGRPLSPPFTPGWDVAGVVEAVGFGVTRFAVGDRVFGMPEFPKRAGAYAEFATSRSRQLARTPHCLTDVEAAALPLAGLTAYQALVDTGGVAAGDRVLVLAAAGGVGHLAVQIAKARGAVVIAVARERHHETLTALGADELIDHTRSDVGAVLGDADVVLDLVGGQVDALPALRDGGLFINVVSGHGPRLRALAAGRVRIADFLVEPDRVGMEAIAGMAERAVLKPRIAATFPLEDAAKAHAMGENGQTGGGKLVLVTGR